MKRMFIIGATSAIGAAVVKRVAAPGINLYLVGRDEGRLATVVADAQARGCGEVVSRTADLAQTEDCESLATWIGTLPAMRFAVILPGVLSDEFGEVATWMGDVAVNLTAPSFFARLLADKMERDGKGGHLTLIGSVAGDRGRQSNGFYGAQKGGLEIYAEALHHRMSLQNQKVSKEARVLISFVKPGFVNSPMTAKLDKNALFSEPSVIAQKILSLSEKGRSGVVYAPGWWRLVMLVIRSVPRVIFFRTRL